MSKVRILADDLTGALDTAAKFVPVLNELTVSWVYAPDDPGGAVFDTETRNLSAQQAGARIAAATPWLCAAEISYKKLDSQLRGPSAEEIAAAFRSGQFTHGIIAPAFPAQWRCTRNGHQWVRDSAASDWRAVGPDLGAQLKSLGLNVNHSRAPKAPSAPVTEGLTLWDAESDGDLDAIVEANSHAEGRLLWCGSAGLAGALARRHGGNVNVPASRVLPAPLLFIIGTARPGMLRQITELSRRQADCWIRAGENTANTLRAVESKLTELDYVLLTFDLRQGLSEQQAGQIIRQRMRYLLERLLQPGSLFVSGGETLHGALDMLGADGIRVDGEFDEGIPVGRLCGGRFSGLRLISKSGAFGTPDMLVRIAESVSDH